MRVKFFNPALTYEAHKDEFDATFKRVLSKGNLVGPEQPDVLEFEKNLAKFTGKKYAVALNSGTDALYLSLLALGVGPGDEVIVSAHTFVATVQVINQLGATPVLVDLGEKWMSNITENTKAVIPCHLTGEVLNWQPVKGIPMVDDSCQALGATGLQGVVQCWSFYPAKILGAFGDAGGISTDDARIARDVKDYGNHWKSDYSRWGINSRMDNLQAALLNVRMKYLEDALWKRGQVARRYNEALAIPGKPRTPEGRVWQDYVIEVERRDALYEYLKAKGVETMKNEYPFPILKPDAAFDFEKASLRLPCNENLTDEEVEYVIESVNSFYE